MPKLDTLAVHKLILVHTLCLYNKKLIDGEMAERFEVMKRLLRGSSSLNGSHTSEYTLIIVEWV